MESDFWNISVLCQIQTSPQADKEIDQQTREYQISSLRLG